MADSGQPTRLFLHVGLPKSGSTYIQSVLAENREALRGRGFVYPFVRPEGMFHAAVEVTGQHHRWGLESATIDGTWAALVRRVRESGLTGIISHELLGGASRAQVDGLLSHLHGIDVHLVVTVRDLGRTLVAEWQEQVKNGDTSSFADYSTSVLATGPLGDGPSQFWADQDLGGLLDRWAAVPQERTHVVPCPPDGAPATLLWDRFATAVDIPAGTVDLAVAGPTNPSLGAPQVALLRQVLDALDGRLEQPWRSLVVKRWFAQGMLASQSSARLITPDRLLPPLAAVADRWIRRLEGEEFAVHGDLDDLLPVARSPERDPDEVTDAELLAGLPEVLANMLVHVRELREENQLLRSRDCDESSTASATDRRHAGGGQRRWLPRRRG